MKRRAPDGFTLLELLLAIVLLSLIVGSIMGGINLGRRAWDTSRASESLDEVESAVRATAGLISKSYTVSSDVLPPGASEPPPKFIGNPGSCRFVALSEGGAQWGGLILTEIGVDAGASGSELAVWTKPYRPQEGLNPARGAMKRTVVLKDAADFQLSYYGRPQPGAQEGWAPSWTAAQGLPQLVAIKIAANRLGRVIEATMTVAIRQQ